MAHSNRTARKQERLQKKRAIKAATKAQYQKWAAEGRTKGSDRSKKRDKADRARRLTVRDNKCKNIGDLRSHPESALDIFNRYLQRQYRGRYKGLFSGVCHDAYQRYVNAGCPKGQLHQFLRISLDVHVRALS